MKPTHTRLFPSLMLTLLALWIAGLSWAQGDTPIIISDGSLTLESRGAPWPQWSTGGTRHHPNAGKTVASVDLMVNGQSRTINSNGQPWTVTVQYLGTTVTVATGAGVQGLQVTTNFTAFHQGANP